MAGSYTLYEMYKQKNPYTGEVYNQKPAASTQPSSSKDAYTSRSILGGTIGSIIGGAIGPPVLGTIIGGAAGDYLTGGGYKDDNPYTPTTPTNTPTTTQTKDDDPGPPEMSYEEAYKMAYDSYNPQFDILRGRTEQEFSKAREQAPQMVAAKYGGVSALRGGRMKSQEAQLTQKEAQAIQDLESQRLATINQAARDIQTKTNTAQAENWYKQQELKQRQREAAAAERNRQALSNMQRENDYLRQVLRLLGVEV